MERHLNLIFDNFPAVSVLAEGRARSAKEHTPSEVSGGLLRRQEPI